MSPSLTHLIKHLNLGEEGMVIQLLTSEPVRNNLVTLVCFMDVPRNIYFALLCVPQEAEDREEDTIKFRNL